MWFVTQEAARTGSKDAYAKFAEVANEGNRNCTLRGQIDFRLADKPLDLSEVEEAASIVKRFCTGQFRL